jgi:hypothetical protein
MFAKNVARRNYGDVGLIAIGEAGWRSDFPLILKAIYLGPWLFTN